MTFTASPPRLSTARSESMWEHSPRTFSVVKTLGNTGRTANAPLGAERADLVVSRAPARRAHQVYYLRSPRSDYHLCLHRAGRFVEKHGLRKELDRDQCRGFLPR